MRYILADIIERHDTRSLRDAVNQSILTTRYIHPLPDNNIHIYNIDLQLLENVFHML